VTNSRHKGKREPLGRVESKPESARLPAGVSSMCVFPAPNSARLARNFPLFRLIGPVPTTFGSLAGRIPLHREKTDPPMRLLCSFAANHPALRYSVTSLFNPPPTAKNPHEVVNPCNCDTCT
jgi:hypothetical protein